jgi:hypothetical protein
VNPLSSLQGASPALIAVVLSTAAMFAVAISFLVAAARLRRSNMHKAKVWQRLEGELGEVIAGIALGKAGVEALHERVASSEHMLLLDYLYKSVVRDPDARRRRLYREAAKPYLHLLMDRARTGDVWQRARAIRSLGELAGVRCEAVVVAALDDPAPHVAMTAARMYARLGLGGVEALLQRIDRYLSWDRRLLRSILVSFGSPAVGPLHALLADEGASDQVRAVCADALAALEFAAAGDTAAAILQSPHDTDLHAAALRLLRAPATATQREVVRRLCTSRDEVLRTQAMACLARIGEGADMAALVRALSDPSPWVVRSARNGLEARGIDVTDCGEEA